MNIVLHRTKSYPRPKGYVNRLVDGKLTEDYVRGMINQYRANVKWLKNNNKHSWEIRKQLHLIKKAKEYIIKNYR